MKTTAEERAKMRANLNTTGEYLTGDDIARLLDDIDELLAERRTLRDEMAMAALPVCLSESERWCESTGMSPDCVPSRSAMGAYAVADAMLAARCEKGDGT